MEVERIHTIAIRDAWGAFKAALRYAREKKQISKEHYEKALKGEYPVGPGNCFESAYSPSKKNSRYTQVRYQGTKYYCHRIAAMLVHGSSVDGLEVSHLCHNPKCFNPAHLTAEDGDTNKSRLCCKLYCRLEGYGCPHVPTCWHCKSCREELGSQDDGYWVSPTASQLSSVEE